LRYLLQTDSKLFEVNGAYEVELVISCNHICLLEIAQVKDITEGYPGFYPEVFYRLK
jgi:hypothetical protein